MRAANPQVLFAPVRILRRVIKSHREISGPGFTLPHLHCYVLDRDRLLQIVDAAELGLRSADEAPQRVLLLRQPDAEVLEQTSYDDALQTYWRLAFHATVHSVLEEQFEKKHVTLPQVREWIVRIGGIEFSEIRTVLEQESLLLPPGDEITSFVEFAATYLELRCFVPSFLERFFPGLTDHRAIEELLAELVDAGRLYRETRPTGAAKPPPYPLSEDLEFAADDAHAAPQPRVFLTRRPAPQAHHQLVERAEKMAARGNLVRSAIAWMRARSVAPPEARTRARAAAADHLDRLIGRLQQALDLPASDRDRWREPLMVLLAYAAEGGWTTEARLLYDLQKICVETERNVYRTDLVGWAFSLGKRPLMRPLPRLREVLRCRHLQRAAHRLSAARLSKEHRQSLHFLLQDAADRAERALRDRFRPLIHAVLRSQGLSPQNLPERVGLQKLVEELLDHILRRGYLTMGDLRDALARNDLKLPDFSEIKDLLFGDSLLRADRRLAIELEGVHKRGEFYLRWMQILSSLAFGTTIGRFLTRFVAVPFGGAYLAVAGIQHLVHKFTEQSDHAPTEAGTELVVLVLGLFLMGMLNVERFRRGIWGLVKSGYRAMRRLFVDLPRALMALPWVQRVIRSPWFRLGVRYLVKPAMLTAAVTLLADYAALQWRPRAPHVAALFLASNLLLNSRLGRNLEEVALEWLLAAWRRLGFHVLARTFWFIMDLFRAAVDAAERLLYTVDEWLRFRSGERRVTLAIKAILNPAWLALSYVARFCITLLIEPQINPIKHFPVVTVSHKLLLPLIPALTAVLDVTMERTPAAAAATVIIAAIPGAFGFLVWELRENWRLYQANRAQRLKPAVVGSHGESFSRLLRPGFHSGAIPKRFAKLRRAEQIAQRKKRWSAVRKHLHGLAEIEHDIRNYLQRELMQLLNETPCWRATPISVGRIALATNRIAVELKSGGDARPGNRASGWLVLELQANWLIGRVAGRRWLDTLTAEQLGSLQTAIAGAYKIAGADLCREELERQLPASIGGYGFDSKGLVVWTDATFRHEARYRLRGDALASDLTRALSDSPLKSDLVKPTSSEPTTLPPIDRQRLLLVNHVIPWRQWVDFWEQAREGKSASPLRLTSLHVLPGEG